MPRLTPFSVTKLFSSRPAPTKRIIETAISAVISKFRQRITEDPARLRSVARIASAGRAFEACHAGISPKIIPVTSDNASVNSITRGLRVAVSNRGRFGGASETRKCWVHAPNSNPPPQPAMASTALCTRSSPIMRPRLAPSAKRMVISRCLPMARTSSRFARFAQEMSRINPTAPSRIARDVRALKLISVAKGTISAARPLFDCGYCAASPSEIELNSACADASVAPGRRRPTTSTRWSA